MITMFLYGISILFSPGPVTILCIHQGLNRQFKQSIGFCIGVGLATFILFVLFGFTGSFFVKKEYLFYLSIIGGAYICYLAYKIFTHEVVLDSNGPSNEIRLKHGLMMQLFNPKAALAALPIATISFPANNITGMQIVLVSSVFLGLGFLSPFTYAYVGQFFSEFIQSTKTLRIFNKCMAILLAGVGVMLIFH